MNKLSTPYNIASLVMLLLTVLVLIFYCLILVGVLDPFPARARVTRVPTDPPTAIPTTEVAPTWTEPGSEDTGQTGGPEMTPSVQVAGNSQTAVLPPTQESFAETPPTATVEPSPTPEVVAEESGDTFENPAGESAYPFTIQGAGPSFMPQYVYPAAGCNWLGIAGQVFGLQGEELSQNLVVHVWGDGRDDIVTVGQSLAYGESGWEVFLGNETKAATYHVQLLHQDARQLSDVVTVRFDDSCAGNLAMVYFQQREGF